MWKGDLKGKIATDSLNYKETYGLGPIEFLKGEIVVFDGQTFVSKVIDSISYPQVDSHCELLCYQINHRYVLIVVGHNLCTLN